MELTKVYDQLVALSPVQVVLALLLLVLQSLVVSSRWMMILAKTSLPVPYLMVLRAHYLSLSSSLILPNVVAEPAVKAYFLKKYNVPVSEAVTSVIIDKLFVLIGLFGLTMMTAPLILITYPQTRDWLHVYILVIISMLLLQIILYTGILHNFRDLKLKSITNLKKHLDVFKRVIFDKNLSLPGFMLSLLSQFFAICSVYVLSLTMDPGLSFYQCLLFMPPVMLATAIPIAFNGWGIRELAMIYVLGFVNISSEAAFVLSVQFGTIGLMLWSIGLLLWIPVKREESKSV